MAFGQRENGPAHPGGTARSGYGYRNGFGVALQSSVLSDSDSLDFVPYCVLSLSRFLRLHVFEDLATSYMLLQGL